MAQYMSGQQMAAYNSGPQPRGQMGGRGRDQINITDREDYDYDYDKWIHYGDYWIRPDGTISMTPPVTPNTPTPTEPSTPSGDTSSRDDSNEYEESDDSGGYDYSNDVYGGNTTKQPDYDSLWNQYYKGNRDERGNLIFNFNDYLYGTGAYIGKGLGMQNADSDAQKGQWLGNLLLGPIGGIIGGNAGPYIGEGYRDLTGSRMNEEVLDFIEKLDSTNYASGKVAGAAFNDLAAYLGRSDLSNFAPEDIATMLAYGSLYPSLNSQAGETNGLADANSLRDFLIQQQGLSSMDKEYGMSGLDPQRVMDSMSSLLSLANSSNVTGMNWGLASDYLGYLLGPNYQNPVRNGAIQADPSGSGSSSSGSKTGTTINGGLQAGSGVWDHESTNVGSNIQTVTKNNAGSASGGKLKENQQFGSAYEKEQARIAAEKAAKELADRLAREAAAREAAAKAAAAAQAARDRESDRNENYGGSSGSGYYYPSSGYHSNDDDDYGNDYSYDDRERERDEAAANELADRIEKEAAQKEKDQHYENINRGGR